MENTGGTFPEPTPKKEMKKAVKYTLHDEDDEEDDTVETRKSVKTAEKALKHRFFINAKERRMRMRSSVQPTQPRPSERLLRSRPSSTRSKPRRRRRPRSTSPRRRKKLRKWRMLLPNQRRTPLPTLPQSQRKMFLRNSLRPRHHQRPQLPLTFHQNSPVSSRLHQLRKKPLSHR